MMPSTHQEISFRYTANAPEILERACASCIVTSYQAGLAISIGTDTGKLMVRATRFDRPMGVCRTKDGLALATRDAVWRLPASREIGTQLATADQRDIVFIARHSHRTGDIMAHEITEDCTGRLWVVNTLFNGLVTIEGSYNFAPQWKPSFIDEWSAEDRCHINGLSLNQQRNQPAYVSLFAQTNHKGGWRENGLNKGCVINIQTGIPIASRLCLPHSPRLHEGYVYVLNSGEGALMRCAIDGGEPEAVAMLPGFTRGMDFAGNIALIGLSRMRQTSLFERLPLRERNDELRCGVAFVNILSGQTLGWIEFEGAITEVSDVCCLDGYRNPCISTGDPMETGLPNLWHLPPVSQCQH